MKQEVTPIDGFHYSTNEQFTGKYWIDGKKIYQKTYYLLHQSAGSVVEYVSIDTSDINSTLKYMVNLQGNVDFLFNNLRIQRSGSFNYINGNDNIAMMCWGYSPNGIGINTQMKHPTATFSDFNFYATIQYTKTTD